MGDQKNKEEPAVIAEETIDKGPRPTTSRVTNLFIDKLLLKIQEIILAVSVLGMAVLLIGAVFFRMVINSSLTFTEELGTAMLLFVTFVGMGLCTRQSRHISMSMVFDVVSLKKKRIMMMIVSSVTTLVLLFIAYLGIQYDISVFERHHTTAALGIPFWIIDLSVPIGFVFGAIETFRTFLANLRNPSDCFVSSNIKVGDHSTLWEVSEDGMEKMLEEGGVD